MRLRGEPSWNESFVILKLVRWVYVFAIVLTLLACDQDDPVRREEHNRLLALQGGPAAFQCKEIEALIPKGEFVEGQTCSENKAVVNGWSILCLDPTQCNTAARLAELNQAAEAHCAEWCTKKKCDYKYTNREKCTSSWCERSELCIKHCDTTFRDHCYFQELAPNYNCECKERIQGRSRPLESLCIRT